MTAVLWIVAVACMLLGLLGVFLPLLPGVPLLFGGMLLAAWLDDFAHVGTPTVAVLAVLTLLAWLVENLASVWGVQRAGANDMAIAGAGVGAFLGIFAGLPGLILGPVVGAVCGEYLARRDHRTAARAGIAAGIGLLVAIVAKLAIAVTMLAIFVFAWFA